VGGDELNVGRTGKVVRVSGQNVEVMIKSRSGLEVIVNFKKTELARAPSEVNMMEEEEGGGKIVVVNVEEGGGRRRTRRKGGSTCWRKTSAGGGARAGAVMNNSTHPSIVVVVVGVVLWVCRWWSRSGSKSNQ